MSSWRDTASALAQADLDALLNAVLPKAHELLVAQGGFFPFSATLTVDGELTVTPSAAAGRRPPRGTEVLDGLYADARAQAQALRATAFVADVRAGTRDAIAVQLEHQEHLAIGVLLAYRRNWITKKVKLGQLLATTGTPRVWRPAGDVSEG